MARAGLDKALGGLLGDGVNFLFGHMCLKDACGKVSVTETGSSRLLTPYYKGDSFLQRVRLVGPNLAISVNFSGQNEVLLFFV